MDMKTVLAEAVSWRPESREAGKLQGELAPVVLTVPQKSLAISPPILRCRRPGNFHCARVIAGAVQDSWIAPSGESGIAGPGF